MLDKKKYLDLTGLQGYNTRIKSWTSDKIDEKISQLPKVVTTGNYEDLIDKTHGYIDSYVSLDSAKAVRAYMSSFYGDSATPSLNGDAVNFDIDLGYKYNVTYDGQTYTDLKCVGTDFNLENYGVPKTTIIGNTAMYTSANWQDWELMTDTFELPFLIIHERLKTSYKIWLFTATSGSHTIELSCTGYPNDSDTLDENIDTTVHTVTLTTGVQKQFSVEIPGTYPGWEHNNDFYANNNPLGSNVNGCNLHAGKNLIVTFDGVDYNVTSYRYYDTETYVSSGYGYTTYFVGNWKLNSLFAPLISTMSARGANTYDSIPDNTDDYPFCFSCTWGKPTGASVSQMDNMLFATTAGNHTLSIRSTDSWSQLGPNYDQSSWDGGTFTLVGEVIPGTPAIYKVPEWFRGIDSFNQYRKDGETKNIFVEGNSLKVTYDNTEYDLTVIKDASTERLYCGNPGLSSYLEDESNDTPFLLLNGTLHLPDSVAGQIKEISGKVLDRSILKLDNKYLSEDVLQPDWEEDDNEAAGYIKNKPTLANVATSGSFSDLRNIPLIRSQWELSGVSLGIYEPVQYRHIDMYVKYGSENSMVYSTPPAGTWVFVRVEYSTDGSYWSKWQSERIAMNGSSSFIRVEQGTGHEGNLDITDILGDDTIQYFKVTALVVEASLTAGTGGRANQIGSVTFVKPRGQIAANNAGLVNGGQVYQYVASATAGLVGAMHFKDSVSSDSDLPSNPEVGDVYISNGSFTYNSEQIEPGDLFIRAEGGWTVVQGNLTWDIISSSEINNLFNEEPGE